MWWGSNLTSHNFWATIYYHSIDKNYNKSYIPELPIVSEGVLLKWCPHTLLASEEQILYYKPY